MPTRFNPSSSRRGQDKPYNDQCPVAYTTVTHRAAKAVTGCVATAMAQIMYYYKYPVHGQGKNSVGVYWPSAPDHTVIYTVDFSKATYDWNNMLNVYANTEYTAEQDSAVARLMYHCGVACNMSYDPDGSGAYTADAAMGLKKYFGYASTTRVATRQAFNEPEWMDMVYGELNAHRPILYTGNDVATGYGHAFVIDGYTSDGLVHVNWGWEGSQDGYYDIALLNPRDMQFANTQDMVIGIQTTEPQHVSRSIELQEPGTLKAKMGQLGADDYYSLTVKGRVNSTDLKFLRNLAGVDSTGHGTQGRLTSLDLQNAAIVAGGEPYLIEGDKQYVTADNELPERAFFNAQTLEKLVLPPLKHIGDGAFGGCTALTDLTLSPASNADFKVEGTSVFSADGKQLISVMPAARGILTLPEGVTSVHAYALAGCTNVSKVVLPSTVATIGSRAFSSCYHLVELRSRVTTPPAMGNDVFFNTPLQNCKLYVPAGSKKKYKAAAEWAGFVSQTQSGESFDNIIEYGTVIEVRNKTRVYGDANPSFTYRVVGDRPSGEPKLTCQADKTSPVGEYAIVAERGSITDSDVYFTDGILQVTPADLLVKVADTTRARGQQNPDFRLVYTGFKNSDGVSAFTMLPVITCEADDESPEGDYPILVSGGVAPNYELSYQAGVLHVVGQVDAISLIKQGSHDADAVYTLSGTLMPKGTILPPGIYIKAHKKFIVSK